jgi:predicted nicotinamide N-methyase
MTDGDTDALVYLRKNADHNRSRKRICETSGKNELYCHQLLWSHETSIQFVQRHFHDSEEEAQLFDIVIASDIIYAACIIEPLWETVRALLKKNDGIFVMTFARRKVPVSIEQVLQSAIRAGFVYQGGEDENEEGLFTYTFRWRVHS